MSNDAAMIEKIRSLLEKSDTERGATEAEAMAALAAANKLMQKHGLTLEDLGNHREGEDMASKRSQSKGKFDEPAHKLCWAAISKFTGTKMWRGAPHSIDIFGFGGDVEMAHYLFSIINGAMHRGFTDLLARTPLAERTVTRHVMFWSYCRGFADDVNTRIRELIQQNEVESQGKSNELVVRKNAIIEHEFEVAFPNLNLRKGRRSSGNTIVGDVYSEGRKDGAKLNLNRPVGGGNSRKALT